MSKTTRLLPIRVTRRGMVRVVSFAKLTKRFLLHLAGQWKHLHRSPEDGKATIGSLQFGRKLGSLLSE